WPHFQADGDTAMERYLDAVAAAVAQLLTWREARVTFLSTCQGCAEYWADDAAVADRVVERLPPALRCRVEVDREFRSPKALLEVLSGFDMAIATRMHVAILAMCVGTPVLPIAYEFKTTELFAQLGLRDHVCRMESVT